MKGRLTLVALALLGVALILCAANTTHWALLAFVLVGALFHYIVLPEERKLPLWARLVEILRWTIIWWPLCTFAAILCWLMPFREKPAVEMFRDPHFYDTVARHGLDLDKDEHD